MLARLKDAGGSVLGFLLISALTAIPLLFLMASLWAAERLLYVLFAGSWLVLAVVVFVLLPLSLVRRTRVVGLIGIHIASYVFGLSLWLWGLAVTFLAWGWLGIIIGFLFMGVGVVPLGMLASAVHGEWAMLFQMVALGVIVVATRLAPAFLERDVPPAPSAELGGA
jgi:hypothetical protein